jgi:hypothetical protein
MIAARVSEAPMKIPAFWRKFLLAVAIGKAAIAGAGLALAGLGALDIAAAITAQEWLNAAQAQITLITAGGGIVGGITGWVLNRLA